MDKHLVVLWALVLAVCAPVSYAATILVPTHHATIQAAINAAAAGDIIEIENSATYNEDLLIEGPSALPGNKNGLTIRAAASQTPTIVATNTVAANMSGAPLTLFQRGLPGLIQFNFLGGDGLPLVGSPDHKGMIVEADNVTLQGLNIQNPSTTGDPALGTAAALTLIGNNTVIQNCIIQGAPISGNDLCAALTVSFDGPIVNAVLSGALAGTGYETTSLPVTGSQFLNCTLQNTDIAYASVDYGHALLLQNGPVYTEPLISTTTFDTCEFFGNDDISQAANGATTNINCNFHDNTDAYSTEGNSSTFTDCTFSSKVGNNNLVSLSADLDYGGGCSQGTFTNCLFCGGAQGDGMVVVNAGQATFNSCIFAATNTGDPAVRVIRFDGTNFNGDFTTLEALPPAQIFPGATIPVKINPSVQLDNCDLYNLDGKGIESDNDDPGSIAPGLDVTVTDSIFQCVIGIDLPTANAIPKTVTVQNSNIFAGTQFNVEGSWTQNLSNNINIPPQYVDPTGCDPLGFQYAAGTAMDTLGTGGTEIGSQGNTIVPPPPASVDQWSLYE